MAQTKWIYGVAAAVALALGGVSLTKVLAQDEEAAEPAADAAATGSDAAAAPDGEAAAPDGEAAAADAPEPAAQDTGNAAAIDDFMNSTNAANVKDKVPAFYAKDVRYEDPFGAIEGRSALETYYQKLYDGAETVSFEIKEEFVSGDETVALWTMNLKHKSLRGGEAFSVDGVSQFRFAGNQVVFQHNYFDAGALVYENVTFVGVLVRWVKKHVMPAD